jgi:hypothetical protein
MSIAVVVEFHAPFGSSHGNGEVDVAPTSTVRRLKQAISGAARRGDFDHLSTNIHMASLAVHLPDNATALTDDDLLAQPFKYVVVFTPLAANQAPSWKYTMVIRHAARFIIFRKKVYAIAVSRGAFDESIWYHDSTITSTSDLSIELYFDSNVQAQSFRGDVMALVGHYGGQEPLDTLTSVPHSCATLTRNSSWSKIDSPDRTLWADLVHDSVSDVSTMHYHKTLSANDVERECLCDNTMFSACNQKPQWAHLKAREDCIKKRSGGGKYRRRRPGGRAHDGRGGGHGKPHYHARRAAQHVRRQPDERQHHPDDDSLPGERSSRGWPNNRRVRRD